MKHCKRCKTDKPLEAFSKNKRSRDGLQCYCRKCCTASVKTAVDKKRDYYKDQKREIYQRLLEARKDWKRKLADILGGVCIDCGYSNLIALEFDHLDPDEKVAPLSSMISNCAASWEACMAEAIKCELVCSNCHAIRTHYRRIALKNPQQTVTNVRTNPH